jgi:DNA-binding HxlR family transcriptional regulator
MDPSAATGSPVTAFKRSPCPLANTLDIVGDKWTLLIIRDLFLGKRTYNEFITSPEGMRTNTLADRLRKLEAVGVIDKTPYQQKPVRYTYSLTEMGRALGPVVRAMVNWGLEHVPGSHTEQAGQQTARPPVRQARELLEQG